MATYKVLAGHQLPAWLTVEITTEGESKYVTFHSTIYVSKSVKLVMSWGTSFTDADILRDHDVIRKVGEMYDLHLVTETRWE